MEMKRYIINEKIKDSDSKKNVLKMDDAGIRINRFTFLRAVISKDIIFPECRDMEKEICNYHGVEDTEEIMYQDILASTHSDELGLLDIYLHIYYTLLYENNKSSYTIFAGEKERICKRRDKKVYDTCIKCKECSKCKRFKEYTEYTEELVNKRKEIVRYNKKEKKNRDFPFEIIERNVKIKSEKTKKEYYGKKEILDFAPEMVRLYYISNRFNKIFNNTERIVEDKYQYQKIKEIFQNYRGKVVIACLEEIWLCERLFRINLAWKFFVFFKEILKDVTFRKIETEYIDIIRKIIGEVKRWGGIYSQCLIIDKLKLICKIKIEGNKEKNSIEPKKLLKYLYEEILCVKMGELEWFYKKEENRIYNLAKKEDNGALQKLRIECKKLMKGRFTYFNGYYFLNENYMYILENERCYEVHREKIKKYKKLLKKKAAKADNEKQKDGIEKIERWIMNKEEQLETAERFDKKIYALIQKILILE